MKKKTKTNKVLVSRKNSKKNVESKNFDFNTYGYLFNNDFNNKLDNFSTKFNIIKWNGRVNFEKDTNEYYSQRGVFHESYYGSYFIDKRFTSNHKGFVVQKIEKKILELNDSNLPKKEQNSKTYWEIFYIGDLNVPKNIMNKQANRYYSINTDGFVQQECGERSSGHVVQVGTSNFFRYDDPINFIDNMLELTPKLKKIFGKHVKRDLKSNANGLPYSKTPPSMNGLVSSGPTIVHIVEYEWNNTDSETHVKETVHSDDLVLDLMRPTDYENSNIETYGLGEDNEEEDIENINYNKLKKSELIKMIKSKDLVIPKKKMSKNDLIKILIKNEI